MKANEQTYEDIIRDIENEWFTLTDSIIQLAIEGFRMPVLELYEDIKTRYLNRNKSKIGDLKDLYETLKDYNRSLEEHKVLSTVEKYLL